MSHDVVLAGGRVVDPETGFDGVCDVRIDGDVVTAVGDRSAERRSSTWEGSWSLLASSTCTAMRRRCRGGASRRVTGSPPRSISRPVGRRWTCVCERGEAGFPDQLRVLGVVGGGRMYVMADGPLDGGAASIFGGLVGTEWRQAATTTQLARTSTRCRPTLLPALSVSACHRLPPGWIRPSTSRFAELAAAAGVPTLAPRVTSSSWHRRR